MWSLGGFAHEMFELCRPARGRPIDKNWRKAARRKIYGRRPLLPVGHALVDGLGFPYILQTCSLFQNDSLLGNGDQAICMIANSSRCDQ